MQKNKYYFLVVAAKDPYNKVLYINDVIDFPPFDYDLNDEEFFSDKRIMYYKRINKDEYLKWIDILNSLVVDL